MGETPTLLLAASIAVVFAWRFVRTRQLYLTSLAVRSGRLADTPFNPRDPQTILSQGLLGRRSIPPTSFFIRAAVLGVVALCLLPFKAYAPSLWRLVIALIALYVPWCIGHGIMLDRKTERGSPR